MKAISESGPQPLGSGLVAGGNGEIHSPPRNSTALLAREDSRHNGQGDGKIAYIDIGIRENKKHAVLLKYDGVEEVRRVKNLSDLLTLGVKEVYIDALTPWVIPELKTLIEHGVRVFYLSNLRLLQAFREKNGLPKTDENDAKILSLIPTSEFKECTEGFLRLKELLMVYRKLQRRVRKIKQWDNDIHLDSTKKYISECKRKMKDIEEEVHVRALTVLPMYREVLQFIGGREGVDVAELLTIVDFNKGLRKLRRFTGHFSIQKVTKTGKTYISKPKKYSHQARRCLQNIAAAIISVEMNHQRLGRHTQQNIWCRLYREHRSKKRLSLRIQVTTLKFIRGLVRTQNQAGRASPGEKPRRPGKPQADKLFGEFRQAFTLDTVFWVL